MFSVPLINSEPIDFQDTWYDHHATRGYLTFMHITFILQIIPTWRLCQLPKLDRERRQTVRNPEIFYDNRFFKSIQQCNMFLNLRQIWRSHEF
jgi:hypothetical protein